MSALLYAPIADALTICSVNSGGIDHCYDTPSMSVWGHDRYTVQQSYGCGQLTVRSLMAALIPKPVEWASSCEAVGINEDVKVAGMIPCRDLYPFVENELVRFLAVPERIYWRVR
jgi:hypothetical protein